MKLKFDYTFMGKTAIGEHGVAFDEIEKDSEYIGSAYSSVMRGKGKGMLGWCDLPIKRESEAEILEFAGEIRKKAKAFVVLGIGGSALGTLAVANALLHSRHNELSMAKRERSPRLYVEDNIDPERIRALLDVLPPKKTYFNVITKSGETGETLAQFLILYDLLKRKIGKKAARQRVIVTTTIGKGSLYDVAVKEGFKIFGIPEGVGGRFSVLSPVGLLPLAAVGADIVNILNGAAEMDKLCAECDVNKNPALMSAYLMVQSMKKGKNISVMMPYADSLKYMADFYCQLWAESLGKAVNLDGEVVHTGQTPVKALGVTDQHSQVQLYTEGPFDKVVTFLSVAKFRDDVVIPDDSTIADFSFLKGKTLGQLIAAEQAATAYALKKAGRGSFNVILPCVCAYTVGELLTYFMYETAFAGAMLNVNTFDQPGVEEGKRATFAMMGRKGYESYMDEIAADTAVKYTINGEENE